MRNSASTFLAAATTSRRSISSSCRSISSYNSSPRSAAAQQQLQHATIMDKATDVTARPVIGATGVAHGARGAAEAATDGAAGAVATVDIMGTATGMVNAGAAERYRSAPWLSKSSSGWCGAGCRRMVRLLPCRRKVPTS